MKLNYAIELAKELLSELEEKYYYGITMELHINQMIKNYGIMKYFDGKIHELYDIFGGNDLDEISYIK